MSERFADRNADEASSALIKMVVNLKINGAAYGYQQVAAHFRRIYENLKQTDRDD